MGRHSLMKGKWENRFWELAKFVANWSKDPNAGVGAVITTKRGGAIALGYNGFPSGIEDDASRLKDKDLKLKMVVHAEQNALLIAGPLAKDSVIFVWGKPVCSGCAGLIIQSGVSRVVSLNPAIDKGSGWYRSGKLAIKMFREANIKVRLRKS